jgi:hypothetical protein
MTSDKRIIRVFPRRTKATPIDDMAFVGDPPLNRPEADEVHISVALTWDVKEAHRLHAAWDNFYPDKVRIGGPALGNPGAEFVPGRYLKPGYVITSRGCPNGCVFCLVPKREGTLRELPIAEGHNIVDNNLLACSRVHILEVFDMLRRQNEPAEFTGGFEARRVDDWLVSQLRTIRVKRAYLAYDNPACGASIVRAAEKLLPLWCDHTIGCYVLVGGRGDTIEEAHHRLEWVRSLGLFPQAMYYQPTEARERIVPDDWRQMVRRYSQPRLMFQKDKPQVDAVGLFNQG